jgi:hypothetical protein
MPAQALLILTAGGDQVLAAPPLSGRKGRANTAHLAWPPSLHNSDPSRHASQTGGDHVRAIRADGGRAV